MNTYRSTVYRCFAVNLFSSLLYIVFIRSGIIRTVVLESLGRSRLGYRGSKKHSTESEPSEHDLLDNGAHVFYHFGHCISLLQVAFEVRKRACAPDQVVRVSQRINVHCVVVVHAALGGRCKETCWGRLGVMFSRFNFVKQHLNIALFSVIVIIIRRGGGILYNFSWGLRLFRYGWFSIDQSEICDLSSTSSSVNPLYHFA
ncbi:hypothetical protein GYMLUDRAFT_681972 [Collybiopsis luxurians FD-317 M1]|uniref:Uncharacterized protein n=1 Tax=Collybiopsis luxurians FD-317 M1 TaxID=944289 RepID=A0A0D0CKU8_9AGAR|nr:hypothetical protein GYMLUDRAFT_681972 [Collybiopsis luxurians FD-317 M1]